MKRNLSTTIQRTAPQSPACTGGIRGGLIRTALAALLIATAAACSDKEDFGNGDDGNTTDLVTVRFSSVPVGTDATTSSAEEGRPETRTTIRPDGVTVWWTASTDRIGISAVPDPGNTNGTTTEENKQYTPATDGETAQFKPLGKPAEEMQLTPGTYTFYSYYPGDDYSYKADEISVSFTLENFVQDGGNNTAHIGKQDLMWAKTTATVSAGGDPVNVGFTYSHAFPMLRIRNGMDATITRICVRSETDPVKRTARIYLTDEKFVSISKNQEIFLDITGGLAKGDTASLLIHPQTREGGKLIIDVMTKGGTIYELRKTLPSGGLSGGKAYRINFDTRNQSDGNAYTTYGKPAGDGNTTPYQISDEAGLRWLAMAVSYFEVTPASAKITPAKTTIDLRKSYWVPIGNYDNSYTGTFDGNGGTITGLNVDYYTGIAGLFGRLKGEISNLHVEGSVTAINGNNIGGIAGEVQSGSVITNCVFKGDAKGLTNVGGIAGANNGRITGCYSTGNVEATVSRAGGISGYCSESTIEDCYSSSTVKGPLSVGGIIGYNSGGTVTTCYATGRVSAPKQAGGIAGANNGSITNCIALNTEIVRTDGSAAETFGRVAGANNKEDGIQNCAAWNGMTVAGNAITTGDGAATIHGASLTALECVTSTTYTSAPYNFDTNEWDFDGETFTTYLPWNKVLFGHWGKVVKAEIPPVIKNAAAVNTQP